MADFETMMADRRQMLSALVMGGAGLMIPQALLAQKGAANRYPLIRTFVEGFVRRGELPSVLVSVGQGVAPAHYIASGTLAFGNTTAVNKDTLWRIYSMTKPVTGIAVMMLIADGTLRLDQPLSDILPKFAQMTVQVTPDGSLASRPAKTQITIRHLLTHTSGLGYSIMQKGPIRDAYVSKGLVPAQFSQIALPFAPAVNPAPNLTVFADRLATLPLVYEPGRQWSYGMGFDVLGRVIEVVSGMRFDAFLKKRVFEPLGMTSTGFIVLPSQLARLTTNYGVMGGLTIPVDPGPSSIFALNPKLLAGGAGLVSSAQDYDRFLAMLLGEGRFGGEQLLPPETARLAMSNLLPPGGSTKGTWAQGYGFGAGGRVTLPGAREGEGIFGWNGAAGTIGWVDRKRGMRVGGYVQQMPLDAYPFQSLLPGVIQKQFAK